MLSCQLAGLCSAQMMQVPMETMVSMNLHIQTIVPLLSLCNFYLIYRWHL